MCTWHFMRYEGFQAHKDFKGRRFFNEEHNMPGVNDLASSTLHAVILFIYLIIYFFAKRSCPSKGSFPTFTVISSFILHQSWLSF